MNDKPTMRAQAPLTPEQIRAVLKAHNTNHAATRRAMWRTVAVTLGTMTAIITTIIYVMTR